MLRHWGNVLTFRKERERGAFWKVREIALLTFFFPPFLQSRSRVGSAKGCLISPPPLACAAEDYPVTYGAIEMLGKEGTKKQKRGKRCGRKNGNRLFFREWRHKNNLLFYETINFPGDDRQFPRANECGCTTLGAFYYSLRT